MELTARKTVVLITRASRGVGGATALLFAMKRACPGWFTRYGVGCLLTLFIGHGAIAQSFPGRPIRMIIPFAPGGGTDTVGRLLGQKLAESLGQQVVIDNRPSGNGVIASDLTAKAPPDGHTIYFAGTSFTVAPSLTRTLPFDPVKDFLPVTRAVVTPAVLVVHPSLPVKSVAELVQYAKAKPGTLTFGSSGVGAASHLAGELFKLQSGVDMVHVPYKGSAPVATAMLSGEISLTFANTMTALPHVKSGKLKLLGITSKERSPALPDVPTVAEAGVPGYEHQIWHGLILPARTPDAVLSRYHAEMARAMQARDMVDRLAAEGSRPTIEPPAVFAVFLRDETAKWAKVIRAAGMKPE